MGVNKALCPEGFTLRSMAQMEGIRQHEGVNLCCVVDSLNWASQKIQEHMDLVCFTGFISVLLDLSLTLDISNQQPTDRYMRPHVAQSCYERGPTNLLKTLSIFV